LKNATTAAANAEAMSYTSNAQFYRGAAATDVGSGWFWHARVFFPDASYDNTGASTGSRIFAGMSSSLANLGSDDPATHRAGFSRINVNGGRTDANWQFTVKDGATGTLIDTGIAFAVSKAFDLWMFCPPGATTVYWQVDNVTDGTTATGSTADHLPGMATMLVAFLGLRTINAVIRTLRTARVYCERS
jgi:hypothetical protein